MSEKRERPAAVADWNTRIIEEFRANDGRVGGDFEGAKLLLLHQTGARSGIERINPLAYRPVDGGYAVFASKGGADTDPEWLHNLVANPETAVEVGSKTVAVRARVPERAERDAIWNAQAAEAPWFVEYEKKSAREFIPVVVLERI